MSKCTCTDSFCPIRDLLSLAEPIYEKGELVGWQNRLPNFQQVFQAHVAEQKKKALKAKQDLQKEAQRIRKEKWLASKKPKTS